MNSNNALLLFLTIAGAVTIPFLTSNLTGASIAALSSYETSNASYREVVSRGYGFIRKELMTPFGLYLAEQRYNGTREVLESREGKLIIESSKNETLITLETAEGKLRIVQTPRKIEERFESRYGKLIKSMEDGEELSEKATIDDSLLLASYAKVNKTLSELMEKLLKLRNPVWIVEIKVDKVEHVKLVNKGESSISLDGWILRDASGNEYEIEELELEPGACVYLLSDYESCEEGSEMDGCIVACWEERCKKAVWNSDGDVAELYDEELNLVARCSYSSSEVEDGLVAC